MHTLILATALAGLTGHATGGDDALTVALNNASLENASLDSMAWSLTAEPSIKVTAQTQFQYNINLRDDDSLGDNDTTIGFSMRRTRVNIAGAVTDNIKAKIQVEFDAGSGEATMLEAFADWTISDNVSLRIGQQKVHFLREDTVGTTKMLTSDSSVQNRTFGQSYSQFIEAQYTADNWRGWVAFSDGFHSRNTSFNDADEADFGLTGRAEFRFGDADWKAYSQFTSFRSSASGGAFGVAGHYQSRGATNPALADDETLLSFAADFAYVGDGWNAYVSGVWAQNDDGTDEFDDYGLLAQAGVFFTDQLECFARWDGVFVDDDRGAGVDDFNTITVGVNYYITPESHAAKFTANVLYYLDAVNDTGGVVGASAGYNLLADAEDGQIALTAQLQLLF